MNKMEIYTFTYFFFSGIMLGPYSDKWQEVPTGHPKSEIANADLGIGTDRPSRSSDVPIHSVGYPNKDPIVDGLAQGTEPYTLENINESLPKLG